MSSASPLVTSQDITFQVSDADHDFDGVRLELDWHCAADSLDFQPVSDGWALTIPLPPANRFEYQLTLRSGDHYEWTIDHANPRRVENPFGQKSELLLPGYQEPSWLETEDIGRLVPIVTASGPLAVPVPVAVWSPAGMDPNHPAPLLLVHDGSDMAERGSLLRWASHVLQHGGASGGFRIALLDPPSGYRDTWYAANDEYSDHLADVVIPAIREHAPTTAAIGLGASLGAVAMLSLQDRRPDALDGLALQSGSFFTAVHDPQESHFSRFDHLCSFVERLESRTSARPVPTLITCGTLEENYANNVAMAEHLTAQGYPVRWKTVGDAHTMIGWRDAWGEDLAELIVAADGDGGYSSR